MQKLKTMVDKVDILWYGLTALFVVSISSAVLIIREVRAFRKAQNDLLIRIVIGGLADIEDKLNLLLWDKGYTNEKIQDWINAQRTAASQADLKTEQQ